MWLIGLPLNSAVFQLHCGFLRLTGWAFVVLLVIVMAPRVAGMFVIRRPVELRRSPEKMVPLAGATT